MSRLLLVLTLGLLAFAIWGIHRLRSDPRLGWFFRYSAHPAVLLILVIFLPIVVLHGIDTYRVIPNITKRVVPYPRADDPQSDDAKAFELLFLVRDSNAGPILRRRLDSMRSSHVYLLHSTDSPAVVMRFYRDSTTRPGWTMIEDDSLVIFLRRGAERLMLGAHDEGFGRGTRIIYAVETPKL